MTRTRWDVEWVVDAEVEALQAKDWDLADACIEATYALPFPTKEKAVEFARMKAKTAM